MQIADIDNGQLEVIKDDKYLQHYENDIKLRHKEYQK